MIVVLLTLPLLGFALFDAWIAGYLHRVAAEPPRDRLLTVVAYVMDGATIGVACAVVLGIASVVYNLTGARILPPPIPTLLIYGAVIAPSVLAIPLWRYIRSHKRAA